MNGNTGQRVYWQMPSQQSPAPRDPPRNPPPKRTMSSTMETLGIRLRPPGFHQSASSSYYHTRQSPPQQPPPQQQQARVMHENMYASSQLTSQPHQQPWNGFGQSHDYATGNGYLYTPSLNDQSKLTVLAIGPVDIGKPNMYSDLNTDLYTWQYGLLYPDAYQQMGSTEPQSKLFSPDYNLSATYPNTSPLYTGQLVAPATEPGFLVYPDTISCPSSEYTSTSSLTALSPAPSPRCSQSESQSELARGIKRPRGTPSPRPNQFAAPYNLEDTRRCWSPVSCPSATPARRPSPLARQARTPEHITPNTYQFSAPPSFIPNNSLLMTSSSQPPTLGSSPERHKQKGSNHHPRKMLKSLHSNGDGDSQHLNDYTRLSEGPPDLFGPLSEEPKPPVAKDMHPDDPSLMPHEQDLRFDNDLYTPRWVRGHGNKREGWCGICKPGRWLVLKNSAFWYDKSFSHGVSAATGQAFEAPREIRRAEGEHHSTNSSSNKEDMWEGLCGSCGEWIPLISSKKKGTTWFRHAYKCQSRSRDKDKHRIESTVSLQLDQSSASPLATPAPFVELLDPVHNPLYLSVPDGGSGSGRNDGNAVMRTMANFQTLL
ncbi:hypothetical protein BGW36DRAFT_410007 [Talaromyces proteolyticus]|uniref:Transcription regulator Rua1 C-terminal domain-containing protein n=1 Tax=Talaromyces proteolyticus TaxID=1131652 RepID=A0AAD4PXK0_9EURO|nr:uncharacterized protein BGW36DRAFT_410007 [Talaromyces proteolyticus]KAH8692808.1 hypothetical protein BGW36DRAFT_410007 [Talaromyces proteolyticus]